LYLAALLAIGIFGARRSRNARDFYLAGGRLGLATSVLATMAAIISGFAFVGGPGLFLQVGLGSFWIMISSSFTGTLMCWLLAKPLFELSRRQGAMTVPGVLLQRYGCRYCSGIGALAVLLGTIGYLGTQMKALSILLASLIPDHSGLTVALGFGVLVFYSAFGGMIAGVYTDVVQGSIMLWASTLIFLVAIRTAGGFESLFDTLASGAPEALSPWGSAGPVTCLGWFFLFAVGAVAQPHVVNRLMMVKDLSVLRFFPLVLAVCMGICGLVWLGAGSAVRALILQGRLAEPSRPDEAISLFLNGFAPGWLSGLAYLGILAAIMSTVNSFVNIGAAALARDLPSLFRHSARLETPRREILEGRLATLGIFVASGIFSIYSTNLVAYLGILSFGTFAAALTPSLVIGLNWPGAGRLAARVSLTVGLAGVFLFEGLHRIGWYVMPTSSSLPALLLSLLVFLIIGKVEEKRAANDGRPTVG